MRQYNATTVIRQSSRAMLEKFFRHEHCLECLDFQKDKLYEIKSAFLSLPDKILRKLEITMRNVFIFANNDGLMLRLADEIKLLDPAEINEIEQLKSRYDKAFYIYLNHSNIWEKACIFAQSDNLPSRYWTRCTALPMKKPNADTRDLENMGKQISNYFWQKQVRGKKFFCEYQKRTEYLHYYFVYLSDYANSYEFWSENTGTLECHNECRPINMVFAYDEHYGTLDTYNLGGSDVTDALQKIFCETILNFTLIEKKILKSAFCLNHLINRSSMLKPITDIGIVRTKLSSVELCCYGTYERRVFRISTDKNSPDDDIYNCLEYGMRSEIVKSSHTKVRHAKILLDVMINGIIRNMSIDLTNNSCTLKSNLEELRVVGEKYIKACGIDVQPELF